MVNIIHAFLFPFILIVVHEIGHFLTAKKEGIYKGWGILPQPHIKLTKRYARRWAYLSGFAATLFLYPYWIWIWGWAVPHWFLILCLATASLDIVVVIFYKRITKRGQKKK